MSDTIMNLIGLLFVTVTVVLLCEYGYLQYEWVFVLYLANILQNQNLRQR